MTIAKKILFLGFLILFTTCKVSSERIFFDSLAPNHQNAVINFINTNYEQHSETPGHLEKLSSYTKLPMSLTPLGDFNRFAEISSSTRVVVVQRTSTLSQRAVDTLHNFVAKGGALVISEAIEDHRFAFLLGLKPTSKFTTNSTASGNRLKTKVLPGIKENSIFNTGGIHWGLDKENFSSKVTVLVSAANENDYPLIVENMVGKGRVLYLNSVLGVKKTTRGIFFSMLLKGLEGIPYPIPNVASIQLDDFPIPVYKLSKEPVKSNLGLSMDKFVTEVWWPDMKKLAQKHQIKYSAYPAFDYANAITPPFIFNEWDRYQFKKDGRKVDIPTWLGKDLLDNGHELGLHGYNHVSLLTTEWTEPEYMGVALNTARKKWGKINFGNFPVTYVPPSNLVDKVGLKELKDAFPEIKFMQSTYLGELENGGNREFDSDPFHKGFFDVPRISSGFDVPENESGLISSIYLFTGIWSHFVHPDDVFQIPGLSTFKVAGGYDLRNKNKLPWRSNSRKTGLLERFDDEIYHFEQTYPFTRFLTAMEAGNQIVQWRYAQFEHLKTGDLYSVYSNDFDETEEDGYFWFLYVQDTHGDDLEAFLQGQVRQLHKSELHNGYFFQIETKDAFLTVPDYNPYNTLNDVNAMKRERAAYMEKMEEARAFSDRIAVLSERGKLRQASNFIENQLGEDVALYYEYYDLMAWQERESDFWEFLENKFTQAPNGKLAGVAAEIAVQHGGLDQASYKNWLNRAVDYGLENPEVLREAYNASDYETERPKMKRLLQKIAEKSKGNEDLKEYITFLLDTNDPDVTSAIIGVTPCAPIFKRLASPIAWALAEQFYFDKALTWAKCSPGIDLATRQEWLRKTTNFESLKVEDPKTYYGILMRTDSRDALKELRLVKPCREELLPIAGKIAQLFGEDQDYRVALDWARCTNEITISDLLTWNHEAKRFSKAVRLYNEHIEKNPNDVEVRHHMASLYHEIGSIKRAISMTNKLDSGAKFNQLKGRINEEILYLGLPRQYDLLSTYPHIFNEKTKSKILENQRALPGNDIFFKANSTNDRLDPTVLNLFSGYRLMDKKKNIHSISAVRGLLYAINFIEGESDNVDSSVFGIAYEFMNPRSLSLDFRLGGRIEGNSSGQTFYHFNTNLGYSKENDFYYGSLAIRPVQTGPGYARNLYDLGIEGYSEITLGEKWTHVVSLEGHYFSDEEFAGTLANQFKYNLLSSPSLLKFEPLVEASYGTASIDRREGFPYWIAQDRFIAGAGLSCSLSDEAEKFTFNLSATWFYENQNEPSFERYLGGVNCRIKKHFQLSTGFEVYTLENFFSNAFTFGLTYHLKG